MKVLLLLSLVGCSGTLKHVNRIGGGATLMALGCDWNQTRTAADTGWRGLQEGNAILGEYPSRGRVDLYMATATAALALAWIVLPERLRPLVWVPTLAIQTHTIAHNHTTVLGLCGVSGEPVHGVGMVSTSKE